MHKKKIYIIYTGGTIGMQRSEQGYVPVVGHLQQQLQQLPKFHQSEMPSFFIHEYQPLIDSSNMSPAIWQLISDDIFKNYYDYDGFVILHGTDTMAFTASALSFMLENLAKPVIITGSQIPLSELRSDGQSNLLNTLYLAAHYPINEVCLFFNQKLFRGNRVTKVHADGFDAFISPNYPFLVETEIQIRQTATPHPLTHQGELRITPINPQLIGIFTLYPGIDASLLDSLVSQPIKALILRSYGLGNAPHDQALFKAVNAAVERDIVVINMSQCLSGSVNMQCYATGNGLATSGVLSSLDMTLESIITKLHYLLSQSLPFKHLQYLIGQNLRGELTPQTPSGILVG